MSKQLSSHFASSFLVLISLGCTQSITPTQTKQATSPESTSAAEKSATAETLSEDEKKKLLAAKDALFTKLSGQLLETMGQQGPAAAIAVCQQEAPRIAQEIAEKYGVKIGRVGVRLRNAKNKAPDWAANLVAQKMETPRFMKLADGSSAALLPIKLQATCLMCHGPKEQIAADVLAELGKLYPDDQATGFQEGELRGWFWVVAPSSTN